MTQKTSHETFISTLYYIGTAITIMADDGGLKQISFNAPEQQELKENYFTVLAKKQLLEYFAGWRQKFDVPYTLPGTAFQQEVWQALARIPYGHCSTYSDIAREIGRPKAFRAVGLACNKNPLPFIIPCHRVIGANGSLTGYAGGLALKEALLTLEKKHL